MLFVGLCTAREILIIALILIIAIPPIFGILYFIAYLFCRYSRIHAPRFSFKNLEEIKKIVEEMQEKKEISELTLNCAWNFCQKIINGDFSKCALIVRLPQKDDFCYKTSILKHRGFTEYIHRRFSWEIIILDQIDKYCYENNVIIKINVLFHEIGHLTHFYNKINGHYSGLKKDTGAEIIRHLLIHCFELITGLKIERTHNALGPWTIANNIIHEKNNLKLDNYFSIINEVKEMTDDELLKYNYTRNPNTA